MDIGAALDDDQTCYFITGRRRSCNLRQKLQYNIVNELKHKIALKFSKM